MGGAGEGHQSRGPGGGRGEPPAQPQGQGTWTGQVGGSEGMMAKAAGHPVSHFTQLHLGNPNSLMIPAVPQMQTGRPNYAPGSQGERLEPVIRFQKLSCAPQTQATYQDQP